MQHPISFASAIVCLSKEGSGEILDQAILSLVRAISDAMRRTKALSGLGPSLAEFGEAVLVALSVSALELAFGHALLAQPKAFILARLLMSLFRVVQQL